MKLGIYGAGGLGREVLVLAQIIEENQKRWSDIYFIDDVNPGRELKGVPVLDFDTAKKIENIEIVIAVGEPRIRVLLAEKVKSAELTLATLIHPDIRLTACTSIGNGVVLCKNAFLSCDVILGDNVFLQPTSSLGHDVVVGENSIISTFVTLGGNCQIGSGTFIGMSASVKEGTIIGDNTIISMGSIVMKNIENDVIALGNPARVMRRNEGNGVFH
ncbi:MULTISPECIES: acetyltransferase [unclassified Symbiopectobacterium]|uniref:acetyltransferase n=1 Tax=unclassified Symbiopectobacterium TaxID=2794573 RepID=UPI0022267356|nr:MULTISPECIES: acetyltransferase [unclassified Symbiopectobacterium]MCW2474360.1 acetyltransferase [Candidatus Symbiopectobacterium sp. NZEC151]MCW2485601.1 acetyltransferase [Candidatus Symbiopectobacterium sp. NZEC127]